MSCGYIAYVSDRMAIIPFHGRIHPKLSHLKPETNPPGEPSQWAVKGSLVTYIKPHLLQQSSVFIYSIPCFYNFLESKHLSSKPLKRPINNCSFVTGHIIHITNKPRPFQAMQPKEFLNLLLFSCCCLHVNRVGASLLPGRSAFQAGDAVREATKAANGMDSLIQPTEGLKGGIDLSKSLKPDDLSTLRGGTTEVDNGLPKTKDLATLQKPASDVPPISGKSPATAGRPNHISIDSKMSSYEKWKLKAWTAFMKRLGKKQQKTVVDVPKMKDKFFDVQEPSSTPASPATSATTGKTPLKPALDTTPEHEPPVFPATRYKTPLNYAESMEGHEGRADVPSSSSASVRRSHPRTHQEILAPYSSCHRAVCVTSIKTDWPGSGKKMTMLILWSAFDLCITFLNLSLSRNMYFFRWRTSNNGSARFLFLNRRRDNVLFSFCITFVYFSTLQPLRKKIVFFYYCDEKHVLPQPSRLSLAGKQYRNYVTWTFQLTRGTPIADCRSLRGAHIADRRLMVAKITNKAGSSLMIQRYWSQQRSGKRSSFLLHRGYSRKIPALASALSFPLSLSFPPSGASLIFFFLPPTLSRILRISLSVRDIPLLNPHTARRSVCSLQANHLCHRKGSLSRTSRAHCDRAVGLRGSSHHLKRATHRPPPLLLVSNPSPGRGDGQLSLSLTVALETVSLSKRLQLIFYTPNIFNEINPIHEVWSICVVISLYSRTLVKNSIIPQNRNQPDDLRTSRTLTNRPLSHQLVSLSLASKSSYPQVISSFICFSFQGLIYKSTHTTHLFLSFSLSLLPKIFGPVKIGH
ncbi:hypothetical protein VP01_420g2 [Puccinia sorghi]|uniref:Uncharacterized protein n=1 Tax=Puccinia sorghi TaxID=27349 RepID=A0A0L6URK3_9BASI|nr:hypothetical protein VP01_420g2 [Puccinia sorghi]